MSIEIGLTDNLSNTQYAPLAVLCACYQQTGTLEPLRQIAVPMKKHKFSPGDKLMQVLLSVMAGCVTLSEVNIKLKGETGLAAINGWDRFGDQSNLSRMLDALTLTNIDQVRHSNAQIWCRFSQAKAHDWRGYLWLDFDLSGLPCGPRAEASQKGYFSGKKTYVDGS